MRQVKLTRQETSDEGTFGVLATDSGFSCYSGELPDRENKPGKSRIPEGQYRCSWRTSPKHGECYGVDGVPGRSDIEIHAGNWCGDVDKSYKSDVLGCVILGNAISDLAGQKAVISSKDALNRFHIDLDKEDFQLNVVRG